MRRTRITLIDLARTYTYKLSVPHIIIRFIYNLGDVSDYILQLLLTGEGNYHKARWCTNMPTVVIIQGDIYYVFMSTNFSPDTPVPLCVGMYGRYSCSPGTHS